MVFYIQWCCSKYGSDLISISKDGRPEDMLVMIFWYASDRISVGCDAILLWRRCFDMPAMMYMIPWWEFGTTVGYHDTEHLHDHVRWWWWCWWWCCLVCLLLYESSRRKPGWRFTAGLTFPGRALGTFLWVRLFGSKPWFGPRLLGTWQFIFKIHVKPGSNFS